MFNLEKEYARVKTEGLKPLLPPQLWLLNHHETENGKGYDAGAHPNMLVNYGGDLNLFIADPEIVQEMLGRKNALIDKTGQHKGIFQNLFGNSFLFSKSDEAWKSKRKSVAHAFYKDRLVHMLDILKTKVSEIQAEWVSRIDASKDGSVEIDLSQDLLHLFQKFMTVIVLGDDLNDDYKVPTFKRKNDGSFEQSELCLQDAIQEVFEQVITTIGTRSANPLWLAWYKLTGNNAAFTANE